MPVWMHKPRASFLSSVFFLLRPVLLTPSSKLVLILSLSTFHSSSPSSAPLPQSERNVYEPSLES